VERWQITSHGPIRDEKGGIAGLFHPVTETTSAMLSARRTRVLSNIASRCAGTQTVREAAKIIVHTLAESPLDLTWVFFYLNQSVEGTVSLFDSAGIADAMLPGNDP
jgi:hypothetical protein